MAVANIKFWLPVLISMGLIFIFSSIPGGNIPRLFAFQSTVFHLLIYCMLTFFFCRALKNACSVFSTVKIILLGVLFGLIWGALDEFHQSFVPHRSVSGTDILIDGIGSFAGSLFIRWQK